VYYIFIHLRLNFHSDNIEQMPNMSPINLLLFTLIFLRKC